MTRILPTFCLLFLAVATAAAEGDIPSVPLILHPAASPMPALKYPLLPELRDTIPGNAVDHYRQAIQNMKQDAPLERNWYLTVDKWTAAPLKDLPQVEVGKFLKACESTFKEVNAGARSERCEWGMTEEIRKKGLKGLNSSFPDLMGLRKIAALLTLQVRYDLAQGRTGQAARTLQIGFAMARHIGGSNTILPALYGVVIGNLMLERLEELIQQPDSPSFYWPLTDLPRPFIDMRRPLQGERVMIYGNFPGMTEAVSDLHAKPWTREQVEAVVAIFQQMDKNNSLLGEKPEAEKVLRLASKQEGIKKILMDQGSPKDIVDVMPDEQVALLLALQQYDVMFDDFRKWQSLPLWESHPVMIKLEEQQKKRQDDKDGPTVALARLFHPSSTATAFAGQARVDRRIAALRCVEAVRLYAAGHDGKLPSSLEEIKDLPTPLDPVTGKAFDYKLVGDRAFLTCMPFPGQTPSNANTPSFELIMKK
jgi:hypothetical protein